MPILKIELLDPDQHLLKTYAYAIERYTIMIVSTLQLMNKKPWVNIYRV